ncbi:hypothetical protein [Actinoplanes sp. NPDC049681]|uniref:hypothetical protein n=1 Tax=Actinoplanes sp. NPDC049681 TaxID=3363905 RepID=UPI0037B09487
MALTIVAALLMTAGIALTLALLRHARRTPPTRPETPDGGVPVARPAPDPHLPVVAATAGVGPQRPTVVRLTPPTEKPPAISPARVTPPIAPAARRAARNSGSGHFSTGRQAAGRTPSWAGPRA